MMDLFRETTFGRLVRLASGGRVFAYDEELDPSSLKPYQNIHSKSSSSSISLNRDGTQTHNQNGRISDSANPPIVDQEKGADHLLVDWAPNDPQNPQNWSTPKKLFVTFQICLLTTSVYIGSAIYTAGLQGIQADFHISPVHALLGLTLFVIGYALGPMIWVRSENTPLFG